MTEEELDALIEEYIEEYINQVSDEDLTRAESDYVRLGLIRQLEAMA